MLACYVPACKLFKEEDGQNLLRISTGILTLKDQINFNIAFFACLKLNNNF